MRLLYTLFALFFFSFLCIQASANDAFVNSYLKYSTASPLVHQIKACTGCETEICKQVLVAPDTQQCATHFTFERLSSKKIGFNSNMSWGSVGDDIVERRWNFGDGSPILTGNTS